MSPAEMEIVIRNAFGAEANRFLLLAVILVAIGAVVAAYAGSYVQSKASYRALREEIGTLTAQVSATTRAAEEIKAQIGTTTWVQQQRWEAKRELYTNLLTALYRLAHVYRNIVDLYVSEDQYGHPSMEKHRLELQKRRKAREEEIDPLWAEVLRVRGFGELTLSGETIKTLDELYKTRTSFDPEADYFSVMDDMIAALDRAHTALVSHAKKDMEVGKGEA